MKNSAISLSQRNFNAGYAFWILLIIVSLAILIYGGYRLAVFEPYKEAQVRAQAIDTIITDIETLPDVVSQLELVGDEASGDVLELINSIEFKWGVLQSQEQFSPTTVAKTQQDMDALLTAVRNRVSGDLQFFIPTAFTKPLLESFGAHRIEIITQAGSPLSKEEIIAVTVATVMLVISFITLGYLFNRDAKARLAISEEDNGLNQAAILRLLDELADLADGDLTVTTTVSEDFTGAIADSVNFTIDQLRQLVSRINQTAVQVSGAAQESQQTALQLAEASDHQAQEIAGASAAINEMAVTIDQVSANAAESALVASKSVSIANNGAKLVQNTIHGMDTIREQIQDTSKRIKRLGESSQEIGDIVSLINDIADQTNILALNAAIQASMAGDAGRGFAVVADEVQRLAERSASATKQIESLVKTIQSDTNEAVTSMEQTTSEVVGGARLAQDAGVALEEIEGVSANIAELIQNISNAARQQASSAGHISNTMNVIQEITSQTSAGTGATAQAIGDLAGMALELRESVAGFTLPDDMQTEGAGNDAWLFEDSPSDPVASPEVAEVSETPSPVPPSQPQPVAARVVPAPLPIEDDDLDDFDLSGTDTPAQNLSEGVEELFDSEEDFDFSTPVPDPIAVAEEPSPSNSDEMISLNFDDKEDEFDFSEEMFNLADSEGLDLDDDDVSLSDDEFDFSDFEFTEDDKEPTPVG